MVAILRRGWAVKKSFTIAIVYTARLPVKLLTEP
jgi:hypothetical protein